MRILYSFLCLWAFALTAVLASETNAQEKRPLKVFLLAGQSNMQGHAHIRTLDHLGKDPKYGHLLKKIKNENGTWVTRKDVWVAYPERKKYGNLTVGYGANDQKVGPMLMFGTIIGDYYKDHQVLIIKTAWGGRSVAVDFRPPSSGRITFEIKGGLAKRLQKDPEAVGKTYREMVSQVRDVLKNLKQHFPQYQGQGYEIVGFAWFQGWNDMINQTFVDEYSKNLANLIRDLRKDLNVPKMKVVIGELSVGGENKKNKRMLAFRKAQADVAEVPEFKGTVAFVPTVKYWDVDAHEFLQKNWVRRKWSSPEAKKKWETMGSNYPFHYMGSGKVYSLIGYGLAESMKELVMKKE
ncbi:MAG: sialate O-acetylesterase [Gemmataceae bacterium]